MYGQLVIDFAQDKMQKWLPGKQMCKGEWLALQFARRMIKERSFPVIYKEILQDGFAKYYSQIRGFNLITVTYGERKGLTSPTEESKS